MNPPPQEKPMDSETMKAAIEAQFLMGHCVPSPHMARDRTTIVNWSWDVDIVRQQLHVPLNAVWDERILALEVHGLAAFCMDAPPVTWDEDGNESLIPGWEDEPRERWGSVMQDPEAPAGTKVSAARTILETAVKAVELEDLEARIAALEAQSQERTV